MNNDDKRCLRVLAIKSLEIDNSRKFYELFGLRFDKHSHGTGPSHYASKDLGFVFEIYPAEEKKLNHVVIGIVVPNFREVHSQLLDLGVTCSEIVENESGCFFVTRDPDDNRVEVYTH